MSGILEGLRVVDCSWGTAGPTSHRTPGRLRRRRRLGRAIGRRSVPSPTAGRGVGVQPGQAQCRARPEGPRPSASTLVALVRRADVFVESWRPGVADATGSRLRHAPRASTRGLVYCSISGFGPDGPSRDVPGYEAFVHAVVGTMAQQAGHRERSHLPGVAVREHRRRAPRARRDARRALSPPRRRRRPARGDLAPRRRARLPFDDVG